MIKCIRLIKIIKTNKGQTMNSIIAIKKFTSKKTGKEFEALELTAGKYKTILFPSELEKEYLKAYIQKQAHESFSDGEKLSEKE